MEKYPQTKLFECCEPNEDPNDTGIASGMSCAYQESMHKRPESTNQSAQVITISSREVTDSADIRRNIDRINALERLKRPNGLRVGNNVFIRLAPHSETDGRALRRRTPGEVRNAGGQFSNMMEVVRAGECDILAHFASSNALSHHHFHNEPMGRQGRPVNNDDHSWTGTCIHPTSQRPLRRMLEVRGLENELESESIASELWWADIHCAGYLHHLAFAASGHGPHRINRPASCSVGGHGGPVFWTAIDSERRDRVKYALSEFMVSREIKKESIPNEKFNSSDLWQGDVCAESKEISAFAHGPRDWTNQPGPVSYGDTLTRVGHLFYRSDSGQGNSSTISTIQEYLSKDEMRVNLPSSDDSKRKVEPQGEYLLRSLNGLCKEIMRLRDEFPNAWHHNPRIALNGDIEGIRDVEVFRYIIGSIAVRFQDIDFIVIHGGLRSTNWVIPYDAKVNAPRNRIRTRPRVDPLSYQDIAFANSLHLTGINERKIREHIQSEKTSYKRESNTLKMFAKMQRSTELPKWKNERSLKEFKRVMSAWDESDRRERELRDHLRMIHPRVLKLASELFLFADASLGPLIHRRENNIEASVPPRSRDEHDATAASAFIRNELQIFRRDDGPLKDPRMLQLFETIKDMSNEEIVVKVTNNVRIVKEMESLINEEPQEGVDLKPTLLRVLADRIRWPDPTDFLNNCVLIGLMPPSRVYPLETRSRMFKKNKITRSAFLKPKNVKKINQKARDRFASGAKQVLHLREMELENEKLKLQGKLRICSIAEFNSRAKDHLNPTILTPNFPVDQSDKIRQCSDYSSTGSGMNDATELLSRTVLHDHTFLDETIRLFRRRWNRIKLWKCDLKGAYRQLPLKPNERKIATMLLGDNVIEPMTLTFGSRAAVFHFTQFSLLVTTLSIALCAVPALVYIDDEFGPLPDEELPRHLQYGGPEEDCKKHHGKTIPGHEDCKKEKDCKKQYGMAETLFYRNRELHFTMGVKLHPVDGSKSVAPAKSVLILGIRMTVTEDGVSASVDDEKKLSLKRRIQTGLDGELHRDEACRLAGALGFLAYGFRSKLARGYLKPIYDFHFGIAPISETKGCFTWWMEVIDQQFSREDDIGQEARFQTQTILWSDASETHSGCVHFQRKDEIASPHKGFTYCMIPPIITKKHTKNSPLREMFGIIAALLSNRLLVRNKMVMIFGDCTSANGAIRRGYPRQFTSPGSTIIASNIAIATQILTGCIPCGIWIRHTPARWELGDIPSRPSESTRWHDGPSWSEGLSALGLRCENTGIETAITELIDELARLEMVVNSDHRVMNLFRRAAEYGVLRCRD